MKLNGLLIASQIYKYLSKRVEKLKAKNITPCLAVILVGNNPSSLIYIKQKEKYALQIGASIVVYRFAKNAEKERIIDLIKKLNSSTAIQGMIIQLPLPAHLDSHELLLHIDSKKDVDGLKSDSLFTFPLANAVVKILEYIYNRLSANQNKLQSNGSLSCEGRNHKLEADFKDWLFKKHVVVLGKGEAGGKPIIEKLRNFGTTVSVIDSQTQKPELIIKQADIIISAVGKENTVNGKHIKNGTIIIGIGQHRGEDGKFQGDFDEGEIAKVASYYTPTPGGVGVVNVACLLENLITAAENQQVN